jgi:hypothetical protein
MLEDMRNAYRILVGKPGGRRPLRGLYVKITLKWISKKQGGIIWINGMLL